MDPEDVLDFEEDDDGLDVISLGGSDHDGQPVSNHSSSTIPDFSSSNSRHTPHLRPPSPSRSHGLKSPHPPLSGSDKSSRQSSRAHNHPRGPHLGRRNHPVSSSSNRPISKTDRPTRESSSRASHRYTRHDSNRITQSTRTRDRPRPGERASYMPPDRLQAVLKISRASNAVKSSTGTRRPPPSLSTRITDQRDIEPINQREIDPINPCDADPTDHRGIDLKVDTSSNLSKNKHDKSEEKKEARNLDESAVDASTDQQLPEGWISRSSKAGKTYYVNALTRTSRWSRPTQPAVGKLSKSTPRVVSEPSVRQHISERLENFTDRAQADVQKADLTVLAQNSSMVSRSQKHRLDDPSQSLNDPSNKLRLSSKAVSLDDSQSAKSLEKSQHPETHKTAQHIYRQPSAAVSGSTYGSDKDISTRHIPRETPLSAVSESYSRGPQIHPDRRRGIVAVSSHREWDNAPNHSKVSPVGSFHRDLPLSSGNKIGEEYRRSEFVRHPQELDSFRPPANPRPRSFSPDRCCVSSYRQSEHHPREPLSGANGMPNAPGRSFPERILSSTSANEPNVKLESSRYSKSTSISSMPAKKREGHRKADWWRGPWPDHSLNHSVPSQDYGPAIWPSRNNDPVSPGRFSHNHRFHPRTRSPSPPPRRMASHQHFDHGPSQHELYLSERSWPPPASGHMLRDDRLSEAPDSRDLLPPNATHRYNVHRSSSPSSAPTNVLCLHDSRRGDGHPSRNPGPRRVEHRDMGPRRPHVARLSPDLPELPSTAPVQPDFYRPSHASSSKPFELIDSNEATRKEGIYVRPRNDRIPHHLPSKPSCSSSSQNLHRARNFETKQPPLDDVDPCMPVPPHPPEMTLPEANDGDELACDPSCENNDTDGNYAKAWSDMSLLQDAVLPQQNGPLTKRFGPVLADSSESDKLTPPTKRHRRNPIEQIEAGDHADHPTVSTAEVEKTPADNPAPDSNDTSGGIISQAGTEEEFNQIDGFPEMASSPSQHQDEVISLGGRAARKSSDVGVPLQESKVEDKMTTSEPSPACGGSLRDRIQDLNVSSGLPMKPPPFSSIDSCTQSGQSSAARVRKGPHTSRHIAQRISGFRAPHARPPSANGSHRAPRFAPRQSDSGWSGRKPRYP